MTNVTICRLEDTLRDAKLLEQHLEHRGLRVLGSTCGSFPDPLPLETSVGATVSLHPDVAPIKVRLFSTTGPCAGAQPRFRAEADVPFATANVSSRRYSDGSDGDSRGMHDGYGSADQALDCVFAGVYKAAAEVARALTNVSSSPSPA